jgi:sugar phosphate isomerase/epimerase
LSLNRRLFDLKLAATSKTYCDEVTGICAGAGVAITELSTHLLGQLVAVNPAYDAQFDGFAPASVRGNPKAGQAWAVEQMVLAATASANLGLPTLGCRPRSALPDRWLSPIYTLGRNAPQA